ncbi:hypothetical protein NDU88_007402 [Pleurodeles waltl]|uniref:Uncharacterized protein n=1 Tax=Pleurodeles waltl TaxID=8319 RepID=A0AAV7RQV9_PLEWA|nr:hypothetical protein NDU88_007402 [Pleurodeles waltl]
MALGCWPKETGGLTAALPMAQDRSSMEQKTRQTVEVNESFVKGGGTDERSFVIAWVMHGEDDLVLDYGADSDEWEEDKKTEEEKAPGKDAEHKDADKTQSGAEEPGAALERIPTPKEEMTTLQQQERLKAAQEETCE